MSGDRRIFIVVLAALLSLGTTAEAFFQSSTGGSRQRRGGNAAEIYRQAFGLLEDRIPKGMTAEEFDELTQLTELGRISPIDVDRVRALMAKAKPFMDAVGPAGSMRRSDFELDRSKGFDLRLEHLMPMRTTARLLRAQTALAYNDSDWDAALSSLRSWSALSGHAGQDDVMISSLVGNAVGRLSLTSIDLYLDDGTLTQEKAKALVEALRPLRGNDPFNYGQSVRGEFQLMSGELANTRGDELAEKLGAWGVDGSSVAHMSERDLRKSVEKAKDIFSRAALAFENPDPDAARRAIAELEREAELNPVLKLLMPAFSNALEKKLETAAEIAARLDRLDAIADGTKRAIEVANASTWFRRAAAIAAALPDEAQEAVEVVRFAGPSADATLLDRAKRVFLGAGRAMREAIVRGLECGTLDLDAPNDGDFGLSMRWLPGLRGACRTLLAESTTLEGTAAAERALLVAGVSRALVRDPSVTRSLMARSITEEAIPLFERVAADPSVPEAMRSELMRTLRELAASEGFRMAKGLEFDRDRLSTGSPWGRVIDPARRKHVARRGPEFALFLQVAVVSEDRWRALPDPNASRAPVPPPPASTPPVVASPSAPAPASSPAPSSAPSTPAPPATPTPGVLIRYDDLLPPEPTAQTRAMHEKVAANHFFTLIRTVTDSDAEEKFPFRGLSPVIIRTYGTDLASAAETASKLSAIADRLEK